MLISLKFSIKIYFKCESTSRFAKDPPSSVT